MTNTSIYEYKSKPIITNELVIVNIPNYYTNFQMKYIYDELNKTLDNFIILPNDITMENTSIEQLENIVNKLQTLLVTKKIVESNK